MMMRMTWEVYIREFGEEKGYIAFAGRYLKLSGAGFTNTRMLENMDLMQCNIFMSPGFSENSREESIKDAMENMEESERLGR